jgi:hypothetical protein
LLHHIVMRIVMSMRRTTVTLDGDAASVVDGSANETALRLALERWLRDRGQSLDLLRSEGGRIRVLIQVAGEALRDQALDIGYARMAEWWLHSDPGRRGARHRWVDREAARWTAEDDSTAGPAQ